MEKELEYYKALVEKMSHYKLYRADCYLYDCDVCNRPFLADEMHCGLYSCYNCAEEFIYCLDCYSKKKFILKFNEETEIDEMYCNEECYGEREQSKPDQEPEQPDQEPEQPDQEPEQPDQEPEQLNESEPADFQAQIDSIEKTLRVIGDNHEKLKKSYAKLAVKMDKI